MNSGRKIIKKYIAHFDQCAKKQKKAQENIKKGIKNLSELVLKVKQKHGRNT